MKQDWLVMTERDRKGWAGRDIHAIPENMNDEYWNICVVEYVREIALIFRAKSSLFCMMNSNLFFCYFEISQINTFQFIAH